MFLGSGTLNICSNETALRRNRYICFHLASRKSYFSKKKCVFKLVGTTRLLCRSPLRVHSKQTRSTVHGATGNRTPNEIHRVVTSSSKIYCQSYPPTWKMCQIPYLCTFMCQPAKILSARVSRVLWGLIPRFRLRVRSTFGRPRGRLRCLKL